MEGTNSIEFRRSKGFKVVRSLGGKVGRRYKHFVVQTYDYLLEVICLGCEMKFGSTRA